MGFAWDAPTWAPTKQGFDHPPERHYVKYVPVGYADNHSKTIGYLLWIIGFTGAHRFYYGKPLTGTLWFFTFGLLGIGWLIDGILIPFMDAETDSQFRPGKVDYNLAWILFMLVGWMGFHRFYQGKLFTGVLFFLSFGLFGLGLLYDLFTLNDQIDEVNCEQQAQFAFYA